MADRYDVKLDFTASDTNKPGVEPDHETRIVWRDLPYADLAEMEKALVGVLQQTTTWADAKVTQKGPGK